MSPVSFALTVLTCITVASGETCRFSSECTCTVANPGLNVFCEASGSQFPKFTSTDALIGDLTISGNFTNVPENAFKDLDAKILNLNFVRQGNYDEKLEFLSTSFATNKPIQSISFQSFQYHMLIPKELSMAMGLTYLDFENCRIEGIQNETFSDFECLKGLTITNSRLKFIEKTGFSGLEDTLQLLDLTRNELSEIPSDALNNLTSLEGIILQNNDITYVENASFPVGVISIDLNDNPVSDISDDAFANTPSLSTLTLNSCNLTEIPTHAFEAHDLGKLSTLDMANNHIRKISAGAFPINLRTLQSMPSLDDNPISVIELKAFDNLVHVDRAVFRNLYELEEIDMGVFSGMVRLQNVTFNQCRKLRNITLATVADVPNSLQKIIIYDSDVLNFVDPNVGEWLARSPRNLLDVSNDVINCSTDSIQWMNHYLLCTFHPQIKMDGTICSETRVPLEDYLVDHYGRQCD